MGRATALPALPAVTPMYWIANYDVSPATVQTNTDLGHFHCHFSGCSIVCSIMSQIVILWERPHTWVVYIRNTCSIWYSLYCNIHEFTYDQLELIFWLLNSVSPIYILPCT